MSLVIYYTYIYSNDLIYIPTHERAGTLDLLMTYVPDRVRVAVVAPIESDSTPLCR